MKHLLLLLAFCSGIFAQSFKCDKTALATTTTVGAIQVVAPDSDTTHKIRICQVFMQVVQNTNSASDFGLVAGGSGGACAANQVNVTQQWAGVANTIQGFTWNVDVNGVALVDAGKALCLKLSNTVVSAKVMVFYGYF